MTAFAAQTTPWDGNNSYLARGCFAAGLGAGVGRLAAVGFNTTDAHSCQTTDDGGTTWDDQGTVVEFPFGICHAEALDLFVMVGESGLAACQVALSADALTWGAPFTPPGPDFFTAIGTNPAGDTLIAADNSGGIWSSTDGSAWTLQAAPFGFCNGTVRFIAAEDRWYVCGGASGDAAIYYAEAADITTWLPFSTPLDGGFAQDIARHAASGKLYVAGQAGGNFLVAASLNHGATWTTETTPFDGSGFVNEMADSGGALVAAGTTADGLVCAAETPGDGSWAEDTTPFGSPGGGGAGNGALFVAGLSRTFLFGRAQDEVAVVAAAQVVPPREPVVYARVYGIDLSLSDDGVEQVSRLITSPDGFS